VAAAAGLAESSDQQSGTPQKIQGWYKECGRISRWDRNYFRGAALKSSASRMDGTIPAV
jgi:hypothetical protein